MVVPVVLGSSTFDYTPMRKEQARLAKTLVLPSPRDKDDTAQTLEIEDNQATPFKYPTFIKVRYDKDGSLPNFELWMKDNFDQEYKISKERPFVNGVAGAVPAGIGTTTQGVNDDPLVGGILFQSQVANSYAVNPITGDVWRNAYWDPSTRQIKNWNNVAEGNAAFYTPGGGGTPPAPQLIGSVKFDGVTGLALAAVNTRIADISNAVEGVTKILSVCSGNMDAVIALIR